MQANNVEIRVLIKGKPITEYNHRGSVFVEGREGSNFELEVKNHNPFRVEAVLSVDGVSVIDGQEAGITSSGYLVDANSSVRIPGWKLNEEAVAKFVFSGKSESYATQTTGSSANNGVIGLMVFGERGRRPVYRPTRERTPLPRPERDYGRYLQTFGAPAGGSLNRNMRSYMKSKGIADSLSTGQSWYGTSNTQGYLSAGDMQIGASATPTMAHNATLATATSSFEATLADAATLNNLGTGFGRAEEFSTTAVAFNRGDMIAMIVVYYDNARGLKARGIQVGRPSRVKHTSSTPQAFPGMTKGCEPPPGWEP